MPLGVCRCRISLLRLPQELEVPGAARVPILSLRSIHKSYGSVHALRDASLDVHGGEIVALVGDNGAGKSTLVKVMAGATKFNSGEYEIDGKPARIRTPSDATALGIQTVYQDLSLCNNLDAVQNLFLGRELCELSLVRSPYQARRERSARATSSCSDASGEPFSRETRRSDVRGAAPERGDCPSDPVDA